MRICLGAHFTCVQIVMYIQIDMALSITNICIMVYDLQGSFTCIIFFSISQLSGVGQSSITIPI